MALTDAELSGIVADLVKPGSGKHERVRTHIQTLLTIGLGLPAGDVQFERNVRVHEVRGRIDALLGRTIFEFKSGLAAELVEAQRELLLYLTEREDQTGERYVGIATDGAEFRVFERRNGALVDVGRAYKASADRPHELLDWLESAVAARDDVEPEPESVQLDLGKGSVAYGIARRELGEMWTAVANDPEVALKRQLWAQQLERVYGSSVDSDELFFQHTYLTIVAKTMATAIVGIPLPEPEALLTGKAFEDAAIFGAVESDFFDWVLAAPGSGELIGRIARQVMRFRLHDAKVDVLKGLYESLIDPEQRHDLGEYYTPDWLAARVCERAITAPLEQRVLDPACGSGTFVFHAVRRFLETAEAAGYDNEQTLRECGEHVFGIDVHPVAAIIARVTYLLALGDRLSKRRGRLTVPVYLGDSLQWNPGGFLVEGEVLIGLDGNEMLHFPASVAREPGTFDAVVEGMLLHSGQGASVDGFRAWLERAHGVAGADADILGKTYGTLKRLYEEDRDHIWGYVARNLSRPVWLASTGQRAHVLVGNPPWLSYRYMSAAMQQRFKAECEARGIWSGGKVATHQDLSAYFFVRCAELYLQVGGTIAFVMPYSALNLKQYEGFRTGWYGTGRGKTRSAHMRSEVRFTEAWAFDERVKPLFPVLCCVLFAENRGAGMKGGLPASVLAFEGTLPRRDASPAEAAVALRSSLAPLPAAPAMAGGSPYRAAFRNGATVFPRLFFVVERIGMGGLGSDRDAPPVRTETRKQAKPPWNSLPPMSGQVEAAFLRGLILGESIAPFRELPPALAIIPWDANAAALLDSRSASAAGLPRLARWLAQAEATWHEHQRGEMSLSDRLDYHGELRTQFPLATIRVLYAKSGAIPAACVVKASSAVVENSAYWARAETEHEARYLVSILNSEAARGRVESMQAKGQWGARHFDKVMFELPIPKFDAAESLHLELSAKAAEAETVAAAVDVSGVGFVAARGRIRQALRDDGVAAKIDALVERLLG